MARKKGVSITEEVGKDREAVFTESRIRVSPELRGIALYISGVLGVPISEVYGALALLGSKGVEFDDLAAQVAEVRSEGE